jgi:hypothetical protein
MTLSKERKYILILGGILLLLGLIYRYTPSLEGIFTPDDTIELKEQKLDNYRRIAKKRKALEAQLASLRQSLRRAEAGLLSGKTPALAAVEVQNLIKRLVNEKGAQIRTIRVLRPKAEGEGVYVAIPVQATLQSNIRQLKDVLYGIETSRHLLHVKDLRVRAIGRRRQPDQIQSTLTVEGYLKK